ncbi:MAG: Transcription initiation factor IIA small chain (TFIIA 13.5 kDa subunit) [Pleopsidium flavum]|nr:MAG: Transcription initiation factor IIA small chain (TFIIA 13.5 kDa subunit) [Pleopsidium flavum]KAI9878176.1 MAG: Transcription initiation factor IIA small chain (TFIIA 13.5 kDa subunit) [Pleopsidium flavum]
MNNQAYYELYRRSSIGLSLTDTLDDLINEGRIEPQLAMKILANFDRAITEVLADKVKARLNFKVHGHLVLSWPDMSKLLANTGLNKGPPGYVPLL